MIAIKDMKEIPKYCLEVTTRPFYSDETVYNYCPFYNICLHQRTIKSNYKPDDCPLVEIVTCKDCKYYFMDEDAHGYHCERRDTERMPTCSDWYCIHGERKSK